MTRITNVKILTMILLAGFILFNAFLISYAHETNYSPMGGCPADHAVTGTYPDLKCIDKSPAPSTTPSPSPPPTPSDTIFMSPDKPCPDGYSGGLIPTPTGQQRQCIKNIESFAPPEISGGGTLKADQLPGEQCSSIGYPVDVKGNCKIGDTKIYCPESPTPYRCVTDISPGCSAAKPLPASGKCPDGLKKIICGGKQVCGPSGFDKKVQGYTTQIKIPCDPRITGACPSVETPAGYIARIYIFGLMIAGLAAFGGIIYGSLKYVLSAGNIGSQQDAKDQITNAVLGLVLLLGAYIVLYTINPDLVNLRNPQLEVINLAELKPTEEEGGEQRLIAGKGGGDPLCASAINTGITVGLTGSARTGQEVGQIGQDISGAIGEFFGSGGEKKGSYCLKCSKGATKNDAGVCQCNAPLVEYGGGCVPKESIPKTVEGEKQK